MDTLTEIKKGTLRTTRMTKHALDPDDPAYRAVWKRFWEQSARLNRLWKTKKNALQILREERR